MVIIHDSTMPNSEKGGPDEAPVMLTTPSELPIDSDKDLERGVATDDVVESTDTTPDPNVVSWDGPDDPENPQNWPFKRKCAAVAIVSAITFIRCDLLHCSMRSATWIVLHVANLYQSLGIIGVCSWH